MLSVVARLTPVSASSDSRITVGPVPVWTTARSASAPVAKSGNDHASYRVASGTGCTRTRTRVMIPNTPSEPISSWRRSGPAADSGARPRSSTPAGVTARSPRTMSLNRP